MGEALKQEITSGMGVFSDSGNGRRQYHGLHRNYVRDYK